GLPRFLPLLHPRVAAKKTLRLERSAQIPIDEQERASDRETGRAGLAGRSAAGRVNGEIVRVCQLHHLQRLEDGVLKRDRRKIILKAFAVDIDLAAAGRHPNPRDRSLAAARGDEFLSLCHTKSPRMKRGPAVGPSADGDRRDTLSISGKPSGRVS